MRIGRAGRVNEGAYTTAAFCARIEGGAMKSHSSWFWLLAALCVAAPYFLRVQPRTRRQWTYLAVTLAFLAWVLLLMTPLRSR